MSKKQFSVWVEEKVFNRFDNFFTKNKSLFPRQGGQSKAAELVIETGLDVLEKEAKKLNQENKA